MDDALLLPSVGSEVGVIPAHFMKYQDPSTNTSNRVPGIKSPLGPTRAEVGSQAEDQRVLATSSARMVIDRSTAGRNNRAATPNPTR